MIDRIKQILNNQALTAAAFADKLGVPRSTISHILSGRNKPSLEMVNKILDAFPDLRTEWLVRGKGDMYTYPTNTQQGDLFSQDQEHDAGAQSRSSGSESPENQSAQAANDVQRPDKDPYSEPLSYGDKYKLHAGPFVGRDSDEETSSGTDVSDHKHTTTKAVEKIIILYRDGTFMDYLPAAT